MTDERKNVFNILLLSLSFMLVFTGFHTLTSIQTLAISEKDETDSDSVRPEGKGLVNLAIVYVFFGVFSWMSPSLLCLLGPRY